MPAPSSENLALAGANGNIWQMARGALYNRMRPQGYPAFLSDDQKCRLERIRQARMLFEGLHRDYYLIEGRTAYDYAYIKVQGINERMYLTYNVLGLISIKTSDLLFGQAPLLDCEDPAQWDAVQALARRTQLHQALLDASIIASAEGAAYLETIVHTDGQVYVRRVPNESIFPVGEIQPDGQYASYVRYDLRNAGTTTEAHWLLLETTIAAGRITRACWQLDKDLAKTGTALPAARFDPALADLTETGLAANTIVWVPNALGRELSDYDCALGLQDDLNAANTRVKRVLQKHGDPKLGIPRAAADPQGNVPAYAEAFFFDDPNEVPKYITWDANLAAAIQDRADTLNALLVRTETSPVLLGLMQGAAPQSYKSLRLQAFNSLTKAARKSIIWTAAVQRVLDTAMALEQTVPGIGYVTDPVGVTLRDGLPVDEDEQATTIATLRAAGVMSRRRGVRLQLGDEEATDAEIAELEREDAAKTPSVFFGEEPNHQDTQTPSTHGEEANGGAPVDVSDVAPATGQELQTSQDTVLNGAQITAATGIVTSVAAGEMPRDAGLGQLQVLFNLSPEQADQIMGSAGTNVPTTPNPKPSVKSEGEGAAE